MINFATIFTSFYILNLAFFTRKPLPHFHSSHPGPKSPGPVAPHALWHLHEQPFDVEKKIPHRLALARIRLVGGWTNPFEKYARQNGFIFPKWSKNNKYICICIYIYTYIWDHHLDRIWKHNNINKCCLVTFLRELSKKPSLPTSYTRWVL